MYKQQVVGFFLYYAQTVDITIFTALKSIAESQAAQTEKTIAPCTSVIYYISWHPQAAIEYKSSDIQLWLHGDTTSVLSEKARSQIDGYLFLYDNPETPIQLKPSHNIAVHIECQLLKHVIDRASEAKCSAIFHNAQLAVPIKITLEDVGHKKLTTPLIHDTSTASGFSNKEIKRKHPKIWDMRYH